MKTTLKRSLLVGLLSVSPILVLFYGYYSNLQKNIYNFERNINYQVYNIHSYDLKYNSYYFAGWANDQLYLGNYTTRPQLLSLDSNLTTVKNQSLDLENVSLAKAGNYQIQLDSSEFYLLNSSARSILQGDVKQWKARPAPFYCPYFQQVIPIGRKAIVYQYVSWRTKENSLRLESADGRRIENDQIFQKQIDGVFCTSGILNYNNRLGLLTYLYAYRNEILFIDTNLRLIDKMNTIDPITKARIKTGSISSSNSRVLEATSVLVNAKCASWRHYLFVQSKLMGKHEDPVRFKKSTVLDIYDLRKKRYCYSLYLPKQEDRNVSQIRIYGQHIYTLSGQYLVRYTVPMPEK